MALCLSLERRRYKTKGLKVSWAKDPVKWLNQANGVERH